MKVNGTVFVTTGVQEFRSAERRIMNDWPVGPVTVAWKLFPVFPGSVRTAFTTATVRIAVLLSSDPGAGAAVPLLLPSESSVLLSPLHQLTNPLVAAALFGLVKVSKTSLGERV